MTVLASGKSASNSFGGTTSTAAPDDISSAMETLQASLPPPPGKMAKPQVVLLNSFTTVVEWTPPADLHMSPTKSAKDFGAPGGTLHSITSFAKHAPVDGYRLRHQILKPLTKFGDEQDAPFVVLDETWGPDVSRALLKHLTAGADYIFQVSAFNAGGQGPWSDPCDPFHMPGVEDQGEDVVRDLCELTRPALSSALPNSITINWSHPCDRGSHILAYEVLCSTDSGFKETHTREIKVSPDAQHICFEDLVPNTVYYFKYRAVNAVGPSKWSPPTLGIATAATPPDPPDPPIRVGSPPWQSYEVTIKWSPPTSCGIPIQHYTVRVSQSYDMQNAVEISVGGDQKTVVSSGQKFRPHGTAVAATPSSPSGRRPGFNKGHYALTQMKVKGLWPSLTYYFQVKAANQIGESAWSRVSMAMDTAAAPPGKCGKPMFISGTRTGGFCLHWAAPDFLGHKDGISGYHFQVAPNAMFVGAQDVAHVNPRQVNIGGAFGDEMLETTVPCVYGIGMDHFFRVTAFGPAGIGDWSLASDTMKVAPEVPLRPDPPCEFRPMQKAVTVRWKPTSDQGSKVTGYRLRYDTKFEMLYPTELGIVKGDDIEATVPGLRQSCKYYFQVCAINAVGRSMWSESSEPVMLRLLPPAKMAAVHLISSTATSLTVGFTPPLGAKFAECAYVVRYSDAENRMSLLEGVDKDVSVVHDASPDGVTIEGLMPGMPCAFQVYGSNDAGRGELSDTVDLVTDPAPPDTPPAPEMVECTAWSLCLHIKPGPNNGCAIKYFNLEGTDMEDGSTWEVGLFEAVVKDAGPVDFYIVNRLSPGKTYRFRLLVVSDLGSSPWSEYSKPCSTSPQEPEQVEGLYTSCVASRSFKLHWTCPPANGAPVTEYTVQWSINKDFTGRSTFTIATQELEALCDRCTPGTFIYARVAASNSEGYGRYGPEIKQLLQTDTPVIPGKPKVMEVGPIHASVGWLYPFDCGKKVFASWLQYKETDTDGRPDEEKDSGELLIEAPGRSCRIEPLFSSREYIFMVACENEHGLSPFSEPSLPQRIAPPQVPTAAGLPDMIWNSTSEIHIRWSASEALGSDITDQLILASIYPDFPDDKTIRTWAPAWCAYTAPSRKSFDASSVEMDSRPTTVGSSRPLTIESSVRPSTNQSSGTVLTPVSPVGPHSGRPSSSRGNAMSWTISPEMQERRRNAKRGTPVESNQNFGALVKRKKEALVKMQSYTTSGLNPGTYYYFKVAAQNGVGLGAFGPSSERFGTLPAVPDPIPATPGIELLRTGCTTLTIGWQRTVECRGAPITHYVVRYAADRETLWSDQAHEFEHEETVFQSWDGQVIPPPDPISLDKADLQDKDTILIFIEYVMVRFGGLEQAWEWLDVNGNGDVSSQEFKEGDVDNGPPFADFNRKDILDRVWDLLDCDGGGSISNVEFSKLRPYMQEVSRGGHGIAYNGVYCLLPNLLPAKSYYMMVRARSAGGLSSWVECVSGPHKTLCMTPMQAKPIEGVRDERTINSVLLRWELPYDSGEPLTHLQVRWVAQEVDDAIVDQEVMRGGQLEDFLPDARTGKIQTEFRVGGLLPGQLVLAIARGYNVSGGARVWSDLSGPGAGAVENYWDWDTCTASAPPDAPSAPRILQESLMSEDSNSRGEFVFTIGRNNGRKLVAMQFQIYDEQDALVQDWRIDASAIAGATTARDYSELKTTFAELRPGERYSICLRLFNHVGPSEWGAKCEPLRMPPDRPQQCLPLLCEFSSPTYIEVKWKPPHDNGAKITKFELKMALSENVCWDDYSSVDEDAMAAGTKEYGADGRRINERDVGCLVYRSDSDGTQLKPNIKYFFILRACNSVGWGNWSAPCGFLTKPVRPGKNPEIKLLSLEQRSIRVEWEEPECHGKEVLRYDFLASINKVFLNWIQMVTMLVATTVDTDRVMGTNQSDPPEGVEFEQEVGKEHFDHLICDHSMYVCLRGTRCSYDLTGLIPGQTYNFMVRGVNCVGKGEFSNIAGGFKTKTDKLGAIEPLRMQSKTETAAIVSFRLPFNCGCKIEEVALTLSRRDGPLSVEEIDVNTGNCHPHLAGQNHQLIPSDLEVTIPDRYVSKATFPGATPLFFQVYKDEDVEPFTIHEPTLLACTGKTYHMQLSSLRPGTSYEATWSCRSSMGWTPQSDPISFATDASIPDDPVPLVIHGL